MKTARQLVVPLIAALLIGCGGPDDTTVILDRVWDDMTMAQRLSLCEDVRSVGVDATADAFERGVSSPETFDEDSAHRWLSDTCGD